MADEQQQGNINIDINTANVGLNMDQTVNQVGKGSLTYALNAAVENFDSNSVNYQNEPGNEFCVEFPSGYSLVGTHFINEQNKHLFFLTNPETKDSQIGYMENNDCKYKTYISSDCLGFDINYPIHKIVHKITNCSTEIYWTDGFNPRRYLDLNNIPYKLKPGSDLCNPEYTDEVDCNQLKLQPNFTIPSLSVVEVTNSGSLIAGTYQFAVQYADASGNGYSSYYSVTNPTPIANPRNTTPNFDYPVGKSIVVNVADLDVTGQFQYFNLAVIKTVNAITSVELIGTYFIESPTRTITYTGQNQTQIRLSIADIFEKYPYYDIAKDLTTVQDVLIWDDLTSIDRINYQSIASKVTLHWQTYKLPANETYANETNATNLRGYLRDEVYPFEIVFLLKNGKQTDGFHIPGRAANANDLIDIVYGNDDFIGTPTKTDPVTGIKSSPYWKIYNTASVTGDATGDKIGNATPYKYGEFAYWQSEETYPCNKDLWGDLAGEKIRHHKFPDVLVSPIFENPKISINPLDGTYAPAMVDCSVYPIGVRVDIDQIKQLISVSDLTDAQKDDIVGFKIVRGDRSTNQSIVAKGMLRNVGSYERDEQTYYFPNYPYNDISRDPFLLNLPNSYTLNTDDSQLEGVVRNFTVTGYVAGTVEYFDPYTGRFVPIEVGVGETKSFCALGGPTVKKGKICMVSNSYKTYKITRINNFGSNTFNVIYADGESCNGNVPAGYSSWCDFCNTHPTDLCCTGSTIVTQKFNTTNLTVGGSPGTFMIIDSIIKPVKLSGDNNFSIEEISSTGYQICTPVSLQTFSQVTDRLRQVFNSPETSFGQPFLGTVLKLENVMFGAGRAHFVEVQDNAKYKLLTKEAQQDALESSVGIGNFTTPFNAAAMFAAYQSYLAIYVNGITRRNYAYSFNSIASYNYHSPIQNNLGIKQRELKIAQYTIPGMLSVGDDHVLNNYQRESSVYLKTNDDAGNRTVVTTEYNICKTGILFNIVTIIITNAVTGLAEPIFISTNGCQTVQSSTYPVIISGNAAAITITTGNQILINTNLARLPLPFPERTPSLLNGSVSLITDKSRFTISEAGTCAAPQKEKDISVVAYYASLKNIFVNQWGQIYSYNTIDTGFQKNISSSGIQTVFGGDTFISKFAYKTKLPFFIDNRVGAPDDSDIFYDEIGNVAYPKYWHSARSVLSNFTFDSNNGLRTLTNIVSYKAHNLDCPNSQEPRDNNPGRTYYDGYLYLFAYGVPSFYCETSYNLDLRQAFNNKEGDFWPHVSTSIPDDWVQESNVSIAFDNTYYYNPTFSKQNKENFFSHLPPDWEEQLCFTNFPFRAIYSDAQDVTPDVKVNAWLNYSATSFFDFPQNYGKLTSLDGIQNRAVLARFENKSLLYNTMLTVETSNPQAAYLGNNTLFRAAPPIDFAETDLGYVGCQNKMLLKIPQGQVTIDAKRGQIFLIAGNQATDLTAFGSGMNRFFTDHLAFEILRYFPNVNTDNHFNGIGLHGVYDSKYDRVIITKLDYIPINDKIKYDDVKKEFYIENSFPQNPPGTNPVVVRNVVDLTDEDYFCNKSWTISYNFNTKSWVSFHSYIPNWYIGESNFFYSGSNSCCSDLDGEGFSLLAGQVSGVIVEPTTTTTTTEPSPTTTTTTTAGLDCVMTGGTALLLDCSMEGGSGLITVPSPTTTTICQRPDSLQYYVFFTGYTLPGDPTIDLTGSLEDACDAISILSTPPEDTVVTTLYVYTDVLEIGHTLFSGVSDDCTLVADGWYITDESIGGQYVYHVVGGTIIAIESCIPPTTTTTTTL